MPKSEIADPIREKDRRDIVEPRTTKSSTARLEPSRVKLRRDNDEPISVPSKTDRENRTAAHDAQDRDG